MRYIDNTTIKLPNGWEARAADALNEVAQVPQGAARTAAIEARSNLWRELLDPLKALSHDKCWYCECKPQRSDEPVDHFRPKARPIEAPERHPGYWWLAFSWENYRYCCNWCNSRRVIKKTGTAGGKSNHFPLDHEDTRVYDPAGDLLGEDRLLLDPTETTEPALITFTQQGLAEPKYNDGSLRQKEAEKSICLYHLNYYDTKNRRMALYNYIKRKATQADYLFDEDAKGDATATALLGAIKGELVQCIRAEAEFSSAARAFLMGRRSHRDWIDDVLRVA